MTDRSTIIEVMAAAICGPGTPCEAGRNSAERAFSALQAQGLAVVPVEPTEATKRPQLYTDGYYARRIANGERPASHTTNSTKEESDE